MTQPKIQQQRAELERRLRKALPGSEEEKIIRAQLRELEVRQAEAMSDTAPSAPVGTICEEIEDFLSRNQILEAIERLRSLPEHRHEAINLSRRRHAIHDKQRKQMFTDEQAETELNKIVGALLEICAAASSPKSGVFSKQSSESASSESASPAPSTHQSERDYFENVGGNVYTGPVTIHQHGNEKSKP